MLLQHVRLEQIPPLELQGAQVANMFRLDAALMVVVPAHVPQGRELGAALATRKPTLLLFTTTTAESPSCRLR